MRLRAFVRTASIIAGILLLFFACRHEGELGYTTDEKALFLQDFLRHTSDAGGFKDRTIASLVTNDCKKPFLRAWQARYGQPVWDADEPYYNPSDSSANWIVPVRSLLSNELSAVIQFSLRDSSQTLTYKIALAPRQASDDLEDGLLFEYYRQQLGLATLREGLTFAVHDPLLNDDNAYSVDPKGIPYYEMRERCRDVYVNGLYQRTHCWWELAYVDDSGDLSWGSGDDDGGGSGGGFPGNGGGLGNNLPDDEPEPDPETPCGKANMLNHDKSLFNEKMKEHQLKVGTDSLERATVYTGDGQVLPEKEANAYNVRFPNASYYLWMMHTHPPSGEPIFSMGDLITITGLYKSGKIANYFRFGLINGNGEKYALVIDNVDVFKEFVGKYQGEDGKEFLDGIYEEETNGFFQDNWTDKQKEAGFIKFLNENNTGLSLLKDTGYANPNWKPRKTETNEDGFVGWDNNCL